MENSEKKYLFASNEKGTLLLSKDVLQPNGRLIRRGTEIPFGTLFVGDKSFFQLQKLNSLRYISEMKEEAPVNKLLVEQPPTIKVEGKVEFVEVSPKVIVEKTEKEVEELKKKKKLDEHAESDVKLLLG